MPTTLTRHLRHPCHSCKYATHATHASTLPIPPTLARIARQFSNSFQEQWRKQCRNWHCRNPRKPKWTGKELEELASKIQELEGVKKVRFFIVHYSSSCVNDSTKILQNDIPRNVKSVGSNQAVLASFELPRLTINDKGNWILGDQTLSAAGI